jgi:AraC family transcriptional regulator
MMRTDYGARLGEIFHLGAAPSFMTSYLQKSDVMVAQIRCDHANNGLADPIPISEAYLVTTQLRACAEYNVQVDGKSIANAALRAGTSSVFDLRNSVQVENISPFRNVHFLLPYATMNLIAEDHGIAPMGELNHDPGQTMDNSVISGLAMALLPAFDCPDEASTLFVDHVTLALAAYVVSMFGTKTRKATPRIAALSMRQEARTKEILDANRDGNIRLSDIAVDLGLSVRELRSGFRQSTGATPNGWLQARRLDIAINLIQTTALPLGMIAFQSGFASERQMDAAIRRRTGVSGAVLRK